MSARWDWMLDAPPDAALVAAIAAALEAAGPGARAVAVREVTPSHTRPWRVQGRQDNMRGGWPW